MALCSKSPCSSDFVEFLQYYHSNCDRPKPLVGNSRFASMAKSWPYLIRSEYKIPQNVRIPHSSLLQAIAEDINPLATMLTKNTAVSFVALAAPLLVLAVASMAAN